jgi:hypothetical protein
MSLRAISWSSRIYRWLVGAYPTAFRAEYGDEMVWYFEDLCRDTLRKQGGWAVMMLWLRLLPDWGLTVVKERLQQAGYTGAKNMETTQFNNQYTSTLALFSRALRGGYNVKQCLEIIVEHAPEPTKSAFQKVLKRIEAGENMMDALIAMKDDIKSPHVERVTGILLEQMQNGGNLADKLDTLNREIYPELGDAGWAKQVELDDDYNVDENYPLR